RANDGRYRQYEPRRATGLPCIAFLFPGGYSQQRNDARGRPPGTPNVRLGGSSSRFCGEPGNRSQALAPDDKPGSPGAGQGMEYLGGPLQIAWDCQGVGTATRLPENTADKARPRDRTHQGRVRPDQRARTGPIALKSEGRFFPTGGGV